MRYRFAEFLLDRKLGTLAGPEGEVRLRPQTLSLLEVLVEHAPRVLSTDELIDRSWGIDHVSVAAIRQAISELRQALGDSAGSPKIVETVHRRGYRLIAPVERLPASEVREPERDDLASTAEGSTSSDTPEPSASADASGKVEAPPIPSRPAAGTRWMLGVLLALERTLREASRKSHSRSPASDRLRDTSSFLGLCP